MRDFNRIENETTKARALEHLRRLGAQIPGATVDEEYGRIEHPDFYRSLVSVEVKTDGAWRPKEIDLLVFSVGGLDYKTKRFNEKKDFTISREDELLALVKTIPGQFVENQKAVVAGYNARQAAQDFLEGVAFTPAFPVRVCETTLTRGGVSNPAIKFRLEIDVPLDKYETLARLFQAVVDEVA